MMLFIHRQYARRPRRARASGPTWSSRRRSARSGSWCPVPGIDRAVSRRSTSGGRSATTSARCSSPTIPRTPLGCASDWERQVPGVPLVIVESPYRALAGPLLAYLDVLDERLAAGQAGADHVRRDPRVRRPELVGAAALQPVGQAAALGAARAAAHGRRQRAVPARRSGSAPRTGGPGGAVAAPLSRPVGQPGSIIRRERSGAPCA